MATTPVYGNDYYTRDSTVIFRKDLYDPESITSTGERVARVDDLVIDRPTGFYWVIEVLPSGRAVLEPWTPPVDEGLFNNTLIGNGNTSFRAYVDYGPNPNVFCIDSLLEYNGSDHLYIKVFAGNDTTESGEVISAYYNQSGNLVGENIPMELVRWEDANNTAVYAPVVGSLKRPVQHNELLTVVAYGANNVTRSINTLLLVETSFVRRSEASQRHVVGIELRSSFMSPTDPEQINWPTNATDTSSHLMARVTYTDRVLDLPIDGNKFRVSGLEGFIPGREGNNVNLVLHYTMSNDEIANMPDGIVNFDGLEGNTIWRNYKLTTVQGNAAYSVTLFAAPRWVNVVSGYRMEYYLYNKLRNEFRTVTTHVTQKMGSAPFEPTTYGVLQELEVELNLNDVSSSYTNWRHVQKIYVNLQRRGDNLTIPNWLIQYEAGQSPAYGTDLVAKLSFINGVTWSVDITCAKTDIEDWLLRTYFASKPIFDPVYETGPLEPTHVIVHIGTQMYEREINQWNEVFTTTQSVQQGALLGMRFVRRTQDGDLELAYAPMPIHLY